jgi:hypothetical protein
MHGVLSRDQGFPVHGQGAFSLPTDDTESTFTLSKLSVNDHECSERRGIGHAISDRRACLKIVCSTQYST